MSDYVPKVGDIVNVTLRDAKVTEVDDKTWGDGGYTLTVTGLDTGKSREFFVCYKPMSTTVELVKAAEPPAPKWPTAPGSIIGYKFGDSKYVRLNEGWKGVKWAGAPTFYKDDDFNSDYEVLFDAGAPR